VSLDWVLAVVSLGSAAAAVAVASAAAMNPRLMPGGLAGPLARAAYVLAPAVVGIDVWRRRPEERLGRLLIVFTAAVALWTLNGSENPVLFGIAMVVGIFVAPLYSYLLLSFPDGRLHSLRERCLVVGSAAVIGLCWIPLVVIAPQPVIATPLMGRLSGSSWNFGDDPHGLTVTR
jgi:hypothetical protein